MKTVYINYELYTEILRVKAIWFNQNIKPKKRFLSILRTVYPV
jgi:hypothetical protein